ncbi:aspartyl-phosphate phosphatase Spo0E family protein [Paenibacillus barcinonensis]|uniref:Aspartyl-phosphate phosphatase Spo0E family protein n=1 Tax=Paenibacillus barcinonensis TaxID=198119 RepID=A0A2V4VD54_PAEBA|nr:aspartyl-phosphate phosphatase Spo0E family protein [Paenibacillus barcinonensis]PYE50709.1 Spo0E like sporulation regulatory protein [Paenibacillus barcinonensis]QKS57395.1 aspartyl-phosphate phosphatase Spo0E family protein [Paenibacillus barcinonensis]
MDRDELKLRIEEARERLHQLKTEYGDLLHPQVIHQSMVLDELINRYNAVKRVKPME